MPLLSQSKHEQILREEIIPDSTVGISPDERPKAIILAGQPGAGKSGLAHDAIQALEFKTNHVRVDIDELRIAHPDYENLRLTQPKIAANEVQKDASLWGKELTKHCIENRYNLVVDGTLGNAKNADMLVSLLKEKDYQIEIHAMAIDKSRSDQGIYARYENGLETREARWVNPNTVAQDAYTGLSSSIATIERKHPDIAIKLYGTDTNEQGQRATKELNRQSEVSAQKTLETERKREWGKSEKLNYVEVSQRVISKMQGRNAETAEIAKASLNLKGKRFQSCIADLENSKETETSKSLEEKVKEEHKGARVHQARSGTYSGRITHITENEVVQQVKTRDFYVHDLKKSDHSLKINNEVTITNRQGKTLVKNQSLEKTQNRKEGMNNTSKPPSQKTRGLQ